MIHTLHIDDSNPKAKAFLEFIKTLDFIKEVQIDEKQIKKAIDEGIESLEKHGGIPHEEIMSKMKNKYPRYFRA
ncbi:MAG: hypothetical protein ABI207_07595 [Crocinitomicaceae bacterium]